MSYNTPDGNLYMASDPTVITGCWIQPTMFPNLVNYSNDSTKATYLNTFIMVACAYINSVCMRKFNQQTQDYMFPNTGLFYRDYKTFMLPNLPIASVTSVYLQVVNTFAKVDPAFFQYDYSSSMLKILPTFQTYVQTTLPLYALNPATNLWVRFVGGYKVDYTDGHNDNEVPMPIRIATSMYVDYLYSTSGMSGGIGSFSTQTYSQTNVEASKDPILTAIDLLVKPYKAYYVR